MAATPTPQRDRLGAVRARRAVLDSRQRFWTPSDLSLRPSTAHHLLSEFASTGELRHVRRGLYWRGIETPLGMAPPSPEQLVARLAPGPGVGPAGPSAANTLRLSTQVPRRFEVAIPGRAPSSVGPVKFVSRASRSGRLTARLNPTEVSVLEVLGIIRRFSEDLDLLVIGNYASASSQKRALKRLLAAAAVPTGLEPDGVSSGGNAGSFHRYGYLNPPLTDRALVAEFLTSAQQVSAGFSKPDLPVPAGGFAASPAFTRGSEFGERLRVEHDAAMRDLYYGTDTPPTFDDVLDQVHTDATLLSV